MSTGLDLPSEPIKFNDLLLGQAIALRDQDLRDELDVLRQEMTEVGGPKTEAGQIYNRRIKSMTRQHERVRKWFRSNKYIGITPSNDGITTFLIEGSQGYYVTTSVDCNCEGFLNYAHCYHTEIAYIVVDYFDLIEGVERKVQEQEHDALRALLEALFPGEAA